MPIPPLSIENLSFKYRTRPELAIENISIELKEGELLLIAGSSGCGKTTLARCINGLIPRSYRGELAGKVVLYGKEVSEMRIPEMAQIVGTLLQDPERQIVASNVYNEIAFGPENLGLPRDVIIERVEQAMEQQGSSRRLADCHDVLTDQQESDDENHGQAHEFGAVTSTGEPREQAEHSDCQIARFCRRRIDLPEVFLLEAVRADRLRTLETADQRL